MAMNKHTPIADIQLPPGVRSICEERGVTTLGTLAVMPDLYDLPGMDEDAMGAVLDAMEAARLMTQHLAATDAYTRQKFKAEARAAALAKARRTLEYYERHVARVRKKIEDIERG
jgi:hypothetical protein